MKDDIRTGRVRGGGPSGAAGGLRVLVVQHEEPTPGGLVVDWLQEHGSDVEVFRIDLDDRRPDPTRYDMIVSLGSEFAAFDDSIPWIGREKDLLIEAFGADVPILGVCFGGQLLARVLGGESYRGELSEVGWLKVRSRNEDLVPEGPWFQWHFDTFTLPPGAELLADSEAGVQAFAAGRSLGIQFHPEVTNEIMARWVEVYRHELDDDGVDPDDLMDETGGGRTHRRPRRGSCWNGSSMRSPGWPCRGKDEAGCGRKHRRSSRVTIDQASTSVFPKHPGLGYPSVDRARGVRLYTTDGRTILDACSGGAMAAGLGHGVGDIVDAAAASVGGILYYYAHHFTNQPQEKLAERLTGLAPEMTRVRFQSGGAEANETALRLARQYHVDRGESGRWLVISAAQSYHGATMATLALSGRAGLQAPFGPYMPAICTIPPCTERFDPTGEAALDALDEALERAGPENVAAFFCETVSALSLPGYSPPDRFWRVWPSGGSGTVS